MVPQAALSLVLICAAGLVVQSLRNLSHQHFGFETEGRHIVEFDPQMARYKVEQLDNLYHQIRDSLKQIPGVQSVSYAQYTPMSGNNWEGQVNIEGRQSDNDQSVFVPVGPDYFNAIGTRIVQGRPINEQDTATTRPVALVNQEFARRTLKAKMLSVATLAAVPGTRGRLGDCRRDREYELLVAGRTDASHVLCGRAAGNQIRDG